MEGFQEILNIYIVIHTHVYNFIYKSPLQCEFKAEKYFMFLKYDSLSLDHLSFLIKHFWLHCEEENNANPVVLGVRILIKVLPEQYGFSAGALDNQPKKVQDGLMGGVFQGRVDRQD